MYIFNKNHNRTHIPGCRAVGMMNRRKNEKEVEEPQGHLCLWCLRGGITDYVEDHGLDQYLGEETCTDPEIRERLKNHGCTCGSHLGDIRMYPHTTGLLVQGREGTWWVYFHCYGCGYETSHKRLPVIELNEGECHV